MYDVLFMHMFHGFANLSHIIDNFCLGHDVAFRCDSLEEFTTRQAERKKHDYYPNSHSQEFIQIYLQLEYQYHLVIVFECVVEIDQFRMMQLIHYINLLPNQFLLHRMRHGDKLGRE